MHVSSAYDDMLNGTLERHQHSFDTTGKKGDPLRHRIGKAHGIKAILSNSLTFHADTIILRLSGLFYEIHCLMQLVHYPTIRGCPFPPLFTINRP